MNQSIITVCLVPVTSLAILVGGCTITARPATVTMASAYGGWSPVYYNGSLIYYNSVGRPYYYKNSSMVYVPSSWSNYGSAVSNWRTNRVSYNSWHARYHTPRYYHSGRRSKPRGSAQRPAGHGRSTARNPPASRHPRRANGKRPVQRQRHKR